MNITGLSGCIRKRGKIIKRILHGDSISEVSELTVVFLQENVLAFRPDKNRWRK